MQLQQHTRLCQCASCIVKTARIKIVWRETTITEAREYRENSAVKVRGGVISKKGLETSRWSRKGWAIKVQGGKGFQEWNVVWNVKGMQWLSEDKWVLFWPFLWYYFLWYYCLSKIKVTQHTTTPNYCHRTPNKLPKRSVTWSPPNEVSPSSCLLQKNVINY